MSNILIVLYAIMKVLIFFGGGILIGLTICLTIQLISYQLFNFNIYKLLMKKLFN